MTLAFYVAVKVFESAEPHADYPDQIGVVRCCGLPVIQNGQNRRTRIKCSVCGVYIYRWGEGQWRVGDAFSLLD